MTGKSQQPRNVRTATTVVRLVHRPYEIAAVWRNDFHKSSYDSRTNCNTSTRLSFDWAKLLCGYRTTAVRCSCARRTSSRHTWFSGGTLQIYVLAVGSWLHLQIIDRSTHTIVLVITFNHGDCTLLHWNEYCMKQAEERRVLILAMFIGKHHAVSVQTWKDWCWLFNLRPRLSLDTHQTATQMCTAALRRLLGNCNNFIWLTVWGHANSYGVFRLSYKFVRF